MCAFAVEGNVKQIKATYKKFFAFTKKKKCVAFDSSFICFNWEKNSEKK